MSNADIARKLGRNKSTIGRELRRNEHRKFKKYLPDTAQRKADNRKQMNRKQRYVDKNRNLRRQIIDLLENGWSPDLIAGRFKLLGQPYLNRESIYQFIYSIEGRKVNLRRYLRRSYRIRHKRNGRKHRKDTGIPNRVGIEKRPKYVEKQLQFGYWEGDMVIYNRHAKALTTLVERKTRKIFISMPKDLKAKTQAQYFIRRYRHVLPEARRTMTYDNGREAAAHETVTASIGMKFYFARTYASWQRGTNENRNGLVRFYLPKGIDLDKVSYGQIRRVENLINNRPMKVLGYLTPNEAYEIEMNKLLKRKRSSY